MSERSLKELLAERAKLRAENAAADKREHRATIAVVENKAPAEKLFARDMLREYQQISVIRALGNFKADRSMMDASDMGLGKTRMAGSFIGTVGPTRFNRVLWLTSKGPLLKQTRNELGSMGLKIIPVEASNFVSVSEAMDELYPNEQIIYITHYQSLGNMSAKVRDEALLRDYVGPKGRGWDAMFIDEVTAFKGGANIGKPATMWKLAKEFINANPSCFRYFLTGTPVENHPREVWAYMHLFDQDRFPKLSNFEKAFCDIDVRGELKLSNEKMFEMLRGRIIRNTYESCSVDLPPVTEIMEYCDLEDGMVKDLLQRLKREFSMWLDNQPDKGLDVTMVLEQLLRQRQILCTGSRFNYKKMAYNASNEPIGYVPDFFDLSGPFPKLDKLEEKVFELINQGEQVIVYCCFNDPLHDVKSRLSMFTRCEVIDGNAKDKSTGYVHDFQQGKIGVLCINKMSGSHGLNLQKCDQWPGGSSHIFHLDRWWNPARERQALGRIRRMNSTLTAPLFNHYLHVEGEVDDVMLALNQKKQAYADAVDSGITLSKGELRSLLGLG